MKHSLLYITLFNVFLLGCVKSIAFEEKMALTNLYDNKSLGSSAHDLLSDEKYNSLKVEIHYMRGFMPKKEALAELRKFLNKYLNKPNGIYIITKEIDAVPDIELSLNEVHLIEKAKRTVFTTQNQIAIYVLFTNGYLKDNAMLGWAYKNTSAVIFGKKIKENSGAIGQPSRTKLEASVLMHEMSHLLGLVNIGSPTQKIYKEGNHGKHCNNKECLMYYRTEVKDQYKFIMKLKMPALDEDCEADLKANGGK
ncbi:MAG: hypothetical protein WKF91_04190 [Segetibacter sp.]